MSLKRTFLLGAVVALSLTAALGIWILLFESFFNIEEEVFATLGSIVLFCVPALVASVSLEKGHWRKAMIGEMGLCCVGLGVYLGIIWIGFASWNSPWRDVQWKAMGLLATWAIALPWAATVARMTFHNGVKWARLGTLTSLFMGAGMLSVGLVLEIGEDLYWKVFGVWCILGALGTIALPILFKVHRMDRETNTQSTPMELKLTCPRCLVEQVVHSGASRCGSCRLKFVIEIEEPRCPKCSYLLHRLTQPKCPECGQSLDVGEMADGV